MRKAGERKADMAREVLSDEVRGGRGEKKRGRSKRGREGQATGRGRQQWRGDESWSTVEWRRRMGGRRGQ